MAITTADVLAWFDELDRVYSANKDLLTSLDSAIGDADHGINMERGFAAVKTELAKSTPASVGAAFKLAATTLIKTVGGASGPLYGTFFLRAASVCGDKTELDAPTLAACFKAGVDGVMQRGKAVADDKTMVDALLPASAALERDLASGATLTEMLHNAAEAAEMGMMATISMQARKGRASYLGPRSIDHQDPGATSAFLLLLAAEEVWRSK